ncbi:MAG: DNA gyrase inhibitor YacG [Burkholderiales bacterium PBB1]|nr:MAG: DNA gyrase inhibitor YacG [Burkholderiales bacterium PBB1]
MNPPGVPERIVRCPGCGGDSVYAASNLFRPFCSARCKNSDFGAWASEGYRVATSTAPDDNSDGSAPSPH